MELGFIAVLQQQGGAAVGAMDGGPLQVAT